MGRIRRVPSGLDKFFRPLRPRFHGDHVVYFRLLVVGMAGAWGRRHVANLYRSLDGAHQRTRFNNCFLVQRWDPEVALRQKAQELLRALHPTPGDTLDLVIDDSKKAKRGQAMEAVAKRTDPTIDAYIRGHPYGCGMLVFRQHAIPWGLRLYVNKAPCTALGRPFRKTTELAAPLIREFQAPAGVKVRVWCDASYLGPTVVKACREPHVHFASPLKSNRSLFKQGWKLTAGRSGRNLCRRRRPDTLVIAKPPGSARYRLVEAGWLEVSTLGQLQVVFSRQGTAKQILGLVTDAPALTAPPLLQAYDRRWTIEQWVNDLQQLLGRGHDQNRPSWAAVTPLPLVCFASALLPHRRIERHGAPGQRPDDTAADRSIATAQHQLRALLWDDLIADLQEKHHGEAVIPERERLRVA